MPNETWVLVGNASCARLFLVRQRGREWMLLNDLEHPESRTTAHELVADDRGRAQQSDGHAARAAMEPRTEPKEVEARKFARQLAGLLERAVDDHACARLVLIAPPHFLGLLRAELPDKVARRVGSSLDKDYHHLNVRELAQRLSDSG